MVRRQRKNHGITKFAVIYPVGTETTNFIVIPPNVGNQSEPK